VKEKGQLERERKRVVLYMWYISPCMKRKPEPNEPMMFAHRGWVLLLNEEQLAWCDIDRSRNQRLGMSKASAVGMVAARSARWHPGRWILGPKSQGTHFPWVSKMRIWTKFFFVFQCASDVPVYAGTIITIITKYFVFFDLHGSLCWI
jgi:hypothetical protein